MVSDISIGEYSWIAMGVYINMGCNIGNGVIVGAKACVFSPVDDWMIVGGNPALFIKKKNNFRVG